MTTAERTDTNATTPPDLSEFCWVEAAPGGVKSRNQIMLLEDFTYRSNVADVFRSVLRFTHDLKDYSTDAQRNPKYATNVAEGRPRPSVGGGYNGWAVADALHIDLDAKGDIPRVQAELRTILTAFLERWDIPADAVKLSFSGGKGMHLAAPASLFGLEVFGPAPCRELGARIKRTVELLLDGLNLTTVDWGVYAGVQLWRQENHKHSTSGRYCVPITAEEALGPLDALLALADAPRTLERLPDEEWSGRPDLAALWQQAEAQRAQQADSTRPKAEPLSERIPETQRHNSIRRVAVRLSKQGHTEPEILALTSVMNEQRCDPPLPDDELRAIVAWAADLQNDLDDDTPKQCESCDRLREQRRVLLERNQELQNRIDHIEAVCASPGAQGLKVTAIAIDAWVRDQRRRGRGGVVPLLMAGRDPWPGDLEDDEPAPVAKGSIAGWSGQGKATVSRHVGELETVAGPFVIRETKRDPQSGLPRTHCSIDLNNFSGTTLLRAVAALRADDERLTRHGGSRPRCKQCGSERVTTVRRCLDCGHEEEVAPRFHDETAEPAPITAGTTSTEKPRFHDETAVQQDGPRFQDESLILKGLGTQDETASAPAEAAPPRFHHETAKRRVWCRNRRLNDRPHKQYSPSCVWCQKATREAGSG